MREVVVEYEHKQIICKKAKTREASCEACGQLTDWISLSEAAELFTTQRSRFLEFIEQTGIHFRSDEELLICLRSLLAEISRKGTDESCPEANCRTAEPFAVSRSDQSRKTKRIIE